MEEAPTPEKTFPSKENKYSIISDKNHSFSISLILSFPIIKIIGSFKDELVNHIFKIELSLDEFKKSNKYFLLFETLDEIYEDLILLMNKNQTKIFEENNYIKISFPIEIKTIKEISFIMKEQAKNDKEIIQELFSSISELKKENKELKTRIIKLESYLPLLELYKKEKEEKEIIIPSLIINWNWSYTNVLIKWIKEKTNKDKINFEKIFTMSLNGSSSKDFHDYCDNKGPTLTIIKTTENKIFGGFTPLNWDSSGLSKNDNDDQTFIFSLNLMKKYDLINKKNKAIF